MAPIPMTSNAERCRLVRERFEQLGLSITDWAERNGYPKETVYGVLAGRLSGKRGVAHRVAVDLGIKEIARSDELTDRLLAASQEAA